MDRYLSLFRNNWVVGGIIAAVIFVAALAAFGSGLNLADWRNLALILGGVIALPLAVWRSGIAAKQVALIEAGLNTDRYQKGAAMLGDDRLSVRQAGVFGLTELAENNPDVYHILVIKLLCSFIKDRSEEQRKDEETIPNNGKFDPSILLGDGKHGIAPDCQTALNSVSELVKIENLNDRFLQAGVLDLMGANLRSANLGRAHLEGADLEGADLKNAHLHGAHLERAKMFVANLEGADMNGAYLGSSYFTGANLECAFVVDADLKFAVLADTNLKEANLTGANLKNANLRGANLKRANLSWTNLLHADLEGAELNGANLEGANLEGAELNGADLEGANLEGAIGLTIPQLETAENCDPAFLKDLKEAEKTQEGAED